MEFENLLKLINTVSDSNLTQFSYEEAGTVIKMKTDKEQKVIAVNGAPAGQFLSSLPAAGETPGGAVQGQEASQPKQEGNIVKSPLVGTFYSSSTPESEPFVKVGDTVTKGQVLGIIEAMKLMNEIESDFDGVVKEILVSNEDVIEFGQPMFIIG